MTAEEHLERVRTWLLEYYQRAGSAEVPVPPDWPAYEETDDCLILNVEQGTMEWQWLRCGLFTASNSNRLLTPKRREYSASAQGLIARLLGEELLGEPYDWGSSGWTDRGTDLEDRARNWYALEFDVEVRQVGFLLSMDGREGGSPDGLVGADGMIEIKCRSAENHMETVLGLRDFPDAPGQVQQNLKLAGRAWCDMIAYHPSPRLPNRVLRIWRDEQYIRALDDCLARAKREMDEARTLLQEIGPHRVERMTRQEWAVKMVLENGADAEVFKHPMTQDELADSLLVFERAHKAGALSESRKDAVREAAKSGEWATVRAALAALSNGEEA